MIYFRRLYRGNPFEGVDSFAIVVYGKNPYAQTDGKVTRYQKRLQIDLWICVLRFRWITKEKY